MSIVSLGMLGYPPNGRGKGQVTRFLNFTPIISF